jgi:hypothetical protein
MSNRQPLLHPRASLLSLAAMALLTACGGGGGGSSDGASSSNSSTAAATDTVLSGVAATGSPLGGARISVVDAKGKSLGTATTGFTDGRYSINLGTKLPTGPLMVQVTGVDAAGNPQVLHSAVPTVASAMVANITPLTDASVALALGGDPRPVFANASSSASALASLAQAKVAAEFLKTLIKSQLTDVKLTNAATLDLLGDGTYTADKKPQDLLVEAVRVSLGKGSKGEAQLQLAGKVQVSLAPEVTVDLGLAKTELAKATGAAPATAITSTLKATSSYAAVLSTMGTMDDLVAALNKLIAQGSSASTLEASPLLAAYTQNDGRTAADLAALLERYASKNWQLGRFLVTGCADDVQGKGTCAKVQVAAQVTDSSGVVTDLFSDVLSYSKTPAAGVPAWGLAGNGKSLPFQVRAASWLGLEADGGASTGAAGTPSSGVVLGLAGQVGSGSSVIDSATVQTPGGFSIALASCGQPLLCLTTKAGATTATATGALADNLLQPATVGWVGGTDTQRNAKYVASYSINDVAETRSALLPGELPATAPAASRFPILDGVGISAPLTRIGLNAGLAMDWTAWAAANPDLRLANARAVVRQVGQITVRDVPVMPGLTKLTLPAVSAVTGKNATAVLAHELWLTAVDASGRQLVTRYTLLQ